MAQQAVLVSVGGDATLECRATGVPPPLVHWFKGKLRLENSVDGKVSEEVTSGLISHVFQVSLRWALLRSLSRTSTAGPCRFGGFRRWTLVSTAVWPAALLEPPLAPSVWRLEVSPRFSVPHKAYFSLKS